MIFCMLPEHRSDLRRGCRGEVCGARRSRTGSGRSEHSDCADRGGIETQRGESACRCFPWSRLLTKVPATMKPLKPKLLAPQSANAGGQAERWAAACLDYLRTECHLAANTIAAYRRDLNRFSEWLGGRFAAKLGVRELSDYMAWLQTQKLAPASISRHIVALKIFYRYLQ